MYRSYGQKLVEAAPTDAESVDDEYEDGDGSESALVTPIERFSLGETDDFGKEPATESHSPAESPVSVCRADRSYPLISIGSCSELAVHRC